MPVCTSRTARMDAGLNKLLRTDMRLRVGFFAFVLASSMASVCRAGCSWTYGSCSAGHYEENSYTYWWTTNHKCCDCPWGKYTSDSNVAHSCRNCPAGKYEYAHQSCKSCLSGQTSSRGWGYCSQCPAGKYEDDHKSCEGCPDGETSDKGWGGCSECPAGEYEVKHQSCRTCAAGQTSSSGWEECSGCPSGRYEHLRKSCRDCGAGKFSNYGSSSCSTCPRGQFASGEGNSECEHCPSGYLQPSPGEDHCDAAPRGRYASSRTSTNACPPGRYGSSTALSSAGECKKCPAGKYFKNTGYTSAKDGKLCPRGKHGKPGESSDECDGKCPAGHYCPAGTAVGSEPQCGSVDLFCPAGSWKPTAVSSGFYSTPLSVDKTIRESQKECEKGYYCRDGERIPCKERFYGAKSGLTSPECSGLCENGFLCPAGSKSAREEPCSEGDPTKFCVEGYRNHCGSGSYTTPEIPNYSRRTGCEECSVDYACYGGLRVEKLQWQDAHCGTNPRFVFAPEVLAAKSTSTSIGDPLFLEARAQYKSLSYEIAMVREDGRQGDGRLCNADVTDNSPFRIENQFDANKVYYPNNDDSYDPIAQTKGQLQIGAEETVKFDSCDKYKIEVKGIFEESENVVLERTCSVSVGVEFVNSAPRRIDEDTSPLKVTARRGQPFNESVGDPLQESFYDPDGDEIAFQFAKETNDRMRVLGTDKDLFFIDSCSGQVRIGDPVALQQMEEEPTVELVVLVSDGHPGSIGRTTQDLRITVKERNRPPRLSKPLPVLHVIEGADKGCQVGTKGDKDLSEIESITDPSFVSDPDNDDIVVSKGSCTLDTACEAFSMSKNGQLTVKEPKYLNYDDPGNLPQFLPVVYSDQVAGSTEAALEVHVEELREAPVLTTTSFVVDEETTGVIGLLHAEDNHGDRFEYTLLGAVNNRNEDESRISIVNGEIVADKVFHSVVCESAGCNDCKDHDEWVKLTVKAKVTNNDDSMPGPTSSSKTEVHVNIQPIPQPPRFISPSKTLTMEEANTEASIDISVFFCDVNENWILFELLESGDDSTPFRLNEFSGSLSVVKEGGLDYELQNKYSTNIRARNAGTPEKFINKTITVFVVDVPEAPEILTSHVEISELSSPEDGSLAVIQVKDPDLYAGTERPFASKESSFEFHQFSHEGSLQVNTNSGEISVVEGHPLDYENLFPDPFVDVEIHIKDITNNVSSDTGTIRVNVLDQPEPPYFSPPVQNFSMDVVRQGDDLGSIRASDPDLDDTITYELLDGPAFLQVLSFNGLISPVLDLSEENVTGGNSIAFGIEVGDVLELTVEIRDSQNISSVGTHNVRVVEEQAPPRWQDAFHDYFSQDRTYSLSVPEHHEGIVENFKLQCEDPNGGEVQYGVQSANPVEFSSFFRLRADSGELEVTDPSALDFFSMKDHHGLLNVLCSDSTGRQAPIGTINVSISDIPQPPRFRNVPLDTLLQVHENAPVGSTLATIEAFDPDITSAYSFGFEVTLESGETSPIAATAPVFDDEGYVAYANLTVSSKLNYNENNFYRLNLTVIDQLGRLNSMKYELEVDFVNSPPSFNREVYEITVDENVEVNVPLKSDFSFTDRVPFDREIGYQYQVVWSDKPGLFEFVGSDFTLAPGNVLDYESKPMHIARIQIIDGWGLTDEANVTVFLRNLNDIVVDDIISPTLSTEGGDTVKFIGQDLGPIWGNADITAELRSADGLFYASTDCSRRLNDSYWINREVQCQAPEGIGKKLQWTLRVDEHSYSSAQLRSSYMSPQIEGVSSWPLDARTTGNQSFSIEGRGFGPALIRDAEGLWRPTPISVTYENGVGMKHEAINCTVSSPHTLVACDTTEGSGKSLRFQVLVGPETHSWTQRTEWFSPTHDTRYASPEIGELIPLHDRFPTTGVSEALQLGGVNFGPQGIPLLATMTNGNYSLKATCPAAKHNHTAAICDLPPGVGKDYFWSIEVSQLVSNVNEETYSISYDTPVINEVTDAQGGPPVNLDTKGDEVVVISGSNLGPSWHYSQPIVILYGANLEYTAKGCSLESDHTVVECSTVEGIGDNHQWQAIIGQQPSNTLDDVSNYHRPIVGTYRRGTSAPIGDGTKSFRTEGNQEIIIGGSFFGPPGTIPDSVEYGEGNETFQAKNCEVLDHENLRCFTAAGAGDEHLWTVVIGNRQSEVSSTGYGVPEVSGFEGVNGSMPESLNTLGGDEIDIVGQNFGPPSEAGDFLEAVTFGRRGTEFTTKSCLVVSHERIRCIVGEGTGSRHQWIVKVAGQRSQRSRDVTSFASPAINSISPANGPTGYSVLQEKMPRIELQGYDFGINLLQQVEVSVLFDTEGQLSQMYPSSNTNISEVLAEVLEIQQAHPLNFVSEADSSGLSGELLADWLNSIVEIKVDVSMIRWVSTDTKAQKIEFTLPEGFGANLPVMMKVDGKVSHAAWFTYDPPEITNVAPSIPTGGMFDVVIDGKNFCGGSSCSSATCCGTVYVDGEVVEIADDQYTHNQIKMSIPDDQKEYNLLIRVRGQPKATETHPFGTIAPSISGQAKFKEWPEFNTSGGEAFTLFNVRGVDSETTSEDISIEIGGRTCSMQPSISLSQGSDGIWRANMTCLTPEHVGKGLSVNVKINNVSSPTNQFTVDYASPTVCLVQLSPDNLDNVVHVGNEEICEPVFAGRSVSVTSEKLPTMGGDILIHGRNFGSSSLDMSAAVEVEGIGSINITEHTHSFIRGILPEGSGSNLRGTFYIGDPSNSANFRISFNPPSLQSVVPDAIPTLIDPDEDRMTIFGNDFGPPPGSRPADVSVLVAGEKCKIVESSHNSITCIPPNGQGDGVSVTVIVSSQSETKSILSYKPAVMHNIVTESGEKPTSGQTVDDEPVEVLISGENFGTRGQVCFKKQGEHCSNGKLISEAVFNHSVVKFDLPPGYGDNIVEVHVDGWSTVQAGIKTPPGPLLFSYDPPEVHNVERVDATLSIPRDCRPSKRCFQGDQDGEEQCLNEHPQCFPTVGGVPIRLSGKNFGPQHSVVEIRVAGEVCEMDPSHEAAMDHDQVFCTLPSGIGTNIDTQVTVGTASSSVTASFSYDPPRVDSVRPNVPDAEGEPITIKGENFSPGGTSKEVTVLVGELPCLSALVVDGTTIECTTPADVVGPKSINLTAAGRDVFFPQWRNFIIAKCEQHWYGLAGEECLYCPKEEVGAVCPGGEFQKDLIYADKGFWRVNDSTPSDRCHEKRQSRDECPVFLGCIPSFACRGNNTCAEGYTSSRCSQCVEGTHFRMNGECVKCPEHAWLLGVMFAMAAIGATIGGYLINAKQVQLAAFTIGLDYFQVVAIFARTRVDWPGSVERVLQVLSFFNFNLELAAPECYMKPAPPYEVRWISMMAVPLAAAALLLVVYVTHYLYKLCILKRPANKRHTHVNALIATLIIIMYVLYLFLARMTLDVFNCVPADPPDGNLYMSGNTDIICGESDVHVNLLLPLAILAFVVYVGAFPVGSFLFLKSNKDRAKHDQILRAHGQGKSPLANPNYVFRRRYQRLYYLFKPGKWYWITLILLRKLLIAFTALMFRSTPTYQLGMSLLVIFAAFTLQIRHEPYMSRRQYQEVLDDHQRKVADGDEMHMKIQSVIDATNERSAKSAKRSNTMANELSNMREGKHGIPVSEPIVRLLADYNVVESLLLGSALLVSLSGIMLLSGRFDGEKKERNHKEFETLGILTAFVILLSCLYFLLVFVFELLSTFRPKLALKLVSKLSFGKMVRAQSIESVRRGSSRGSVLSPSTSVGEDKYDAHVNPLVTSRQNFSRNGLVSSDEAEDDISELKKRLEDAREEVRRLRKVGNVQGMSSRQYPPVDMKAKSTFNPMSASTDQASKRDCGDSTGEHVRKTVERPFQVRDQTSLGSLKYASFRSRRRRSAEPESSAASPRKPGSSASSTLAEETQ